MLIAYGFDCLRTYCFKSGSHVASCNIQGFITSCKLYKSIVMCGTSHGQIYYMTAPFLEIKKKFYVEKCAIKFVASSKDFKKLVYSTENKSVFIDFSVKRVVFRLKDQIKVGLFNNNSNYFASITKNQKLLILKNYSIYLSINLTSTIIMKICPVLNEFKFAFVDYKGKFFIIDINKKTLEEKGKKLRELGNGFKFSKNTIIKSCLHF